MKFLSISVVTLLLCCTLQLNAQNGPSADLSIFKEVDELPLFPGCTDEATAEARKDCSDEKLINYIYTNIKYPEAARGEGVEGTTVVRFTVEKDGTLGDIKVVRDIGGGCGEESLRVFQSINAQGIKWTPGKKDGKIVRTEMNIPVRYKLAKEDDKRQAACTGIGELPLFPGCADEATAEARKDCSDKKLINYIYTNIKYPEAARKEGIEGTTVVRFMVEKDGTLGDIKVVRDIGGGCDEEALRVFQSINIQGIKWTPGKKDGKVVRTEMNVPVRYKLAKKDEEKKN